MNTLTSLVAYSAWFIFLSTIMVIPRTKASMRGKPLHSFDPDGVDLPGFGHRVTRARNNVYENLPVFAALVLVAAQTNNLAMTDGLAMYVFLARIGQSLTHMISVRRPAVLVRTLFMVIQNGIFAYWVIKLLS